MPSITPPKKTGYDFDGYYDDLGNKYYDSTGSSVRTWDKSSNTILYSHWQVKTNLSCASGKYLMADSDTCSPCPANSYCSGFSDYTYTGSEHGRINCSIGYSSNEGSSLQQDCKKSCFEIKGQLEGGAIKIPKELEVIEPNDCVYTKCKNNNLIGTINNNKCETSQCPTGEKMRNGVCVKCKIENATKYKENGLLECEVEECSKGYHPTTEGCESDIRECKYTGDSQINKSYQHYINGSWGFCKIEDCNNGYHLEENVCIEDTKDCTIENGRGTKTYDKIKKVWGKCRITSCDPGYTSDIRKKNGGNIDECGICSNRYGIDGEEAVSSYINECDIASCMYQGSKYKLSKNKDRCEPVCQEGEDDTGSVIWNAISGSCEITCKDGYISW